MYHVTDPAHQIEGREEPRPDLDRRASGHPYDWHRWFAFWPVRLEDGRRAWLRTVERKLVYTRVHDTGDFDIGHTIWSYFRPCYRAPQHAPETPRPRTWFAA